MLAPFVASAVQHGIVRELASESFMRTASATGFTAFAVIGFVVSTFYTLSKNGWDVKGHWRQNMQGTAIVFCGTMLAFFLWNVLYEIPNEILTQAANWPTPPIRAATGPPSFALEKLHYSKPDRGGPKVLDAADAIALTAEYWPDTYVTGENVMGIEWHPEYSAVLLTIKNLRDFPVDNIDLNINTDLFIAGVGSAAFPGLDIISSPYGQGVISSQDRNGKEISRQVKNPLARKTFEVSCRRLIAMKSFTLLLAVVPPFFNLDDSVKYKAEYVEVSGTYTTELPEGAKRYRIKWKMELAK